MSRLWVDLWLLIISALCSFKISSIYRLFVLGLFVLGALGTLSSCKPGTSGKSVRDFDQPTGPPGGGGDVVADATGTQEITFMRDVSIVDAQGNSCDMNEGQTLLVRSYRVQGESGNVEIGIHMGISRCPDLGAYAYVPNDAVSSPMQEYYQALSLSQKKRYMQRYYPELTTQEVIIGSNPMGDGLLIANNPNSNSETESARSSAPSNSGGTASGSTQNAYAAMTFPIDPCHILPFWGSGAEGRSFKAPRSSSPDRPDRLHAGVDLIAENTEAKVRAVQDGDVIDHGYFDQGTYQTIVDYGDYLLRYAEVLRNDSIVGAARYDKSIAVSNGEDLGHVGTWNEAHIVHLEKYSDPSINGNLSTQIPPFYRRRDLINIEISMKEMESEHCPDFAAE